MIEVDASTVPDWIWVSPEVVVVRPPPRVVQVICPTVNVRPSATAAEAGTMTKASHCQRKLVGSLPWGIPTVVVYRQTGAQATNSMVTQDTDIVFIQVRPRCGRNTYVLRLIVLP